MSTIRIERAHRLGLKRARATARSWAAEAERSHGLRCVLREGPDGDVYEFTRAGVRGRCVASADRFLLEAELDWTLALLRGTIEREIESQLDAAIAEETAKGEPKPTAKEARAKSGAAKKAPGTKTTGRKSRPANR